MATFLWTTLVLLLAAATVAHAGNFCTIQVCSCASKDCTTYTGCSLYNLTDGACGPQNMKCDCAGHINVYANSTCTGSPVNTYNTCSGTPGGTHDTNGCYNKSTCYYATCVAVTSTPSPTPSITPSPSPVSNSCSCSCTASGCSCIPPGCNCP